MIKQHFNFEEIFSFAWSKTKQHAWFLVCTFIIYSIIMSAVRFVPILEQLVVLLVGLSLVSISLIIVKNESFSFADLFEKLRSPNIVIKFLALTIIYIAAVSIFVMPFIAEVVVFLNAIASNGFDVINSKHIMVLLTTILFLIPAFYIAVRFKFYSYVLIENEHLKVIDVIKHTEKLTHNNFWQLCWFFIMITVFNIIGFLAFVFGLIFTIPVSVFAVAHVYRKLAGHNH